MASNPITFTNSYIINGATVLSGTSSADNLIFSGNGLLTNAATLTDNNLGTVTFSGNLGEDGAARALTLSGPGVLALTPTLGANTYSGGTTINMTGGGASFGTVIVNAGSTTSPTASNPLNASSLGSGTITFVRHNGGVLKPAAAAP